MYYKNSILTPISAWLLWKLLMIPIKSHSHVSEKILAHQSLSRNSTSRQHNILAETGRKGSSSFEAAVNSTGALLILCFHSCTQIHYRMTISLCLTWVHGCDLVSSCLSNSESRVDSHQILCFRPTPQFQSYLKIYSQHHRYIGEGYKTFAMH